MNECTSCAGIYKLLWRFALPAVSLRIFKVVNDPAVQEQERDAALLQRIGGGDRAAFSEFYDLHSTFLFSLAVKILGDHKEAEDALQEVFVQIWEKAGTFDPRLGRPIGWVATLVRNKAIDRIRASQRRSRLLDEATAELAPVAGELPSVNESVHGREKSGLIRSAVAGLPNEQRQAIELAFFGGLTQNEISDRLREPLGTVKARIRRGMLRLRDQLEGCL